MEKASRDDVQETLQQTFRGSRPTATIKQKSVRVRETEEDDDDHRRTSRLSHDDLSFHPTQTVKKVDLTTIFSPSTPVSASRPKPGANFNEYSLHLLLWCLSCVEGSSGIQAMTTLRADVDTLSSSIESLQNEIIGLKNSQSNDIQDIKSSIEVRI